MESKHRAPYFAPRAKPVCHLVFIYFSTYPSKVRVFCRDDLENGKSENTRLNAIIKFHDQIGTIRFLIRQMMFSLFTNRSAKRQIFVNFVFFRISR